MGRSLRIQAVSFSFTGLLLPVSDNTDAAQEVKRKDGTYTTYPHDEHPSENQQEHTSKGGPPVLTNERERAPGPHRILGCNQQRLARDTPTTLVDIIVNAHLPRAPLQRRVIHDRRDREAERRPELGERLEERAADGLLVREADLGDEERAGREDEVSAEDGEYRGGEAEGPVRRGGVYHREEEVRKSGAECTDYCWG